MRRIIITVLMGLLISASALAANKLQAIDLKPLSNNKIQLKLIFSDPLSDKNPPRSFVTKAPPRIILDLQDVQSVLKSSSQKVDAGMVEGYQVVTAGGRTRLVINLKESAPYKTVFQNNTALITIGGARTSKSLTEHIPANKQSNAGHRVAGIDFRKGKVGGGQIIVDVSDPNMDVDIEQRGERLQVTFKNTQLPSKLQRRLDVRDFGTPVKSIDTRNKGDNVEMVITNVGDYDHLAYQVNKQFIIDVKSLTKEQKAAIKRKMVKYSGDRLSLNFQDIKVRAVLQLIAEFTGLNIVTSDTVSGSMTLRLNNVPWDQALDIILKTRGLDKRKFGNVMLVAPAAEIAAREKQELKNQQQVEELAPLHSELLQINYAKADVIATLLKEKGNSLLSARGNVSVDERTNTLWIQDTSDKLDEIRSLVKKLDIPVRQVLIEARIVNVEKKFEQDIGIKFGFTRAKHLTGSLKGANDLINGTLPRDVSIADRLNLDLPAPSTKSPGTIGLALAKLGGGVLLDLELSALESENGAEVLSSPRLVTANQHEAIIEKGEEIPYQQATASGATSVAFKKAVLSLRVTPQITPDRKIILTLRVNQDTRGEEVLGTPAINTRQVETQVLVNNGETIVLGGIYERDKKNNVTRIPFLGSLPIIGALFRNTNKIDNRTELLIFVTPKIIERSTFVG